MVRHVFSSVDAVIDAWVSHILGYEDVGDWGRNSLRSVSYKGDIFRSYSTPIAWFCQEQNVVVLDGRKYSVTTSRHLHELMWRLANTGIGRVLITKLPADLGVYEWLGTREFAERIRERALKGGKTACEFWEELHITSHIQELAKAKRLPLGLQMLVDDEKGFRRASVARLRVVAQDEFDRVAGVAGHCVDDMTSLRERLEQVERAKPLMEEVRAEMAKARAGDCSTLNDTLRRCWDGGIAEVYHDLLAIEQNQSRVISMARSFSARKGHFRRWLADNGDALTKRKREQYDKKLAALSQGVSLLRKDATRLEPVVGEAVRTVLQFAGDVLGFACEFYGFFEPRNLMYRMDAFGWQAGLELMEASQRFGCYAEFHRMQRWDRLLSRLLDHGLRPPLRGDALRKAIKSAKVYARCREEIMDVVAVVEKLRRQVDSGEVELRQAKVMEESFRKALFLRLADVWRDMPGGPQGAVWDAVFWEHLLRLSQRFSWPERKEFKRVYDAIVGGV